MKFPYVQFQKKFSPIMPIKLRHKNKEWTEFKAYVDSGASYSIFRSEIIDILGIELEKGKKIHVIVGDGSLIPVYLHKIAVQVAEETFSATIGFSRRLGIGLNIIGRKDIFEKFKICFNEKEKIVEFIKL